MYGDWDKARENSDVDISFSEDYHPNIDFHVWAWGHADRYLNDFVPEPKDFDWLRLP